MDWSYNFQGLSDYCDAPKHIGHLRVSPFSAKQLTTQVRISKARISLQVPYRDAGHRQSKIHVANCPLYNGKRNPESIRLADCELKFVDICAESLTPCQSTGVWIAQARSAAVPFVEDFTKELLAC